MRTCSQSRIIFSTSSIAKVRFVPVVCVLTIFSSVKFVFGARARANQPQTEIALFTEENLPAQDMPGVSPSPGALPMKAAPLPGDANAQLEPTPTAMPTEVAPLEVGSVLPRSAISDAPLQRYIAGARSRSPALAASLRVTDQGRDEILHQHQDDAIQTLGRAVSIDSSNPYAYFYLGRAYQMRRNYPQAITFFKRAEIGFGRDPEWLAESYSFEGLANEQSGQSNLAIAAYQKALVAEPGNLMARVGLNRLGGSDQAPATVPVSVPDASGASSAPPAGGALAPPPNSPPPPPAY
jgi:hypothetical protein